MRMRKKKWVDPYLLNEDKYLIKDKVDSELLKKFKKVYLEIGSGLGDFILANAKDNPDNFYIAFEKDPTCVAISIKKARVLNLENIMFMNKNAMNLEEYFYENMFDGLYLLFSDPWVKSGYYKRRLSYRDFLSKYQIILKNNAFLYFKTDNQQLFEFTKEELAFSKFVVETVSTDFHSEFKADYLTGYETKFKDLGMQIYHIKCLLKKS